MFKFPWFIKKKCTFLLDCLNKDPNKLYTCVWLVCYISYTSLNLWVISCFHRNFIVTEQIFISLKYSKFWICWQHCYDIIEMLLCPMHSLWTGSWGFCEFFVLLYFVSCLLDSLFWKAMLQDKANIWLQFGSWICTLNYDNAYPHKYIILSTLCKFFLFIYIIYLKGRTTRWREREKEI